MLEYSLRGRDRVKRILVAGSEPIREITPRAPAAAEYPARRRKLTAILCADVAGYSRLMGEDEAATYEGLSRLRRAIDPVITNNQGRIVSTAGDGLLAEFASVVDALGCALEMQRVTYEINEPVPASRRLEFRVGINLGDVIVADNDIYGDGVNIAARLQTLAEPGGICISHTVYEHVRNKLRASYRPLGEHRVKNIAEPVRAYAVGAPDLRVTAVRPRLRRRLFVTAATLVAMASGLLAAFYQLDIGLWSHAPVVAGLTTPARLGERIAVAVLPFKNLSGDNAQDFFSDGVTEDVINALGRFSGLLVAAKSASFQFKGRNPSPEEVGHALGARYLIDGSIRRASEQVRVDVELIDAATGRHLWSEDYKTQLKDIFSVQDEIAERVVAALAVRLTRFERDRVLRKPTENLTAYEYVLRGRDLFTNATREMNDEARAMFARAIELDPNYAAAYAALGLTHYEAVVSGWTEFIREELETAEGLANKALALDPATTRAHLLLGHIDLYRRKYERGLAEMDRSLEINPSDVDSYVLRGTLLAWSGKPNEALPWLETALRIDPLHARGLMNLGIAKFLLGNYAEAATSLEQALARSPGRLIQVTVFPLLAAADAELGHAEDTARVRVAMLRVAPLFDARRFAEQFGTETAREQVLIKLQKAGFR